MLRLILISLLLGLALYYLVIDINYIRSTYIIVFLVFVLWELFHYIDRVNRDLTTFFTALSQNDFTTTFNSVSRGKSFNQLYDALNVITAKFKELRAEKEQQLLFLEMLVEHVKAGIISYDSTERIVFMNQSLQGLLQRPRLHYLKAFYNADKELHNTLRDIKTGENKLLKIKINDQLLHLSIHASEFHIGDEYFKLLSIQDIKTELEANEVETWQKLIRVLTHEIMNSVAPITSLSDTLLTMVKKSDESGAFPKTESKNLIDGLEAIKIRGNGLERFTQAYRQLTKIPRPVFQKVNLVELVEKVILLQNKKEIEIDLSGEKNITALIDQDLIAQVLINIIKNAQEALEKTPNPKIQISIRKKTSVEIIISDNGTGIEEDNIDQIFVPFFTTKPQGSGIGLALSRQIMHIHRGLLIMETEKGKGTTFILRF